MLMNANNFGTELVKILNLPKYTQEVEISVKIDELVKVKIQYLLQEEEGKEFLKYMQNFELVEKEKKCQ
jgi:hypothetical protein